MIGLHITYTVRPEAADEAAGYLAEMAAAVREHEPGCLAWIATRDGERPEVFHLTELYADEAAQEAHRETEHFERLVVNGFRGLATDRVAATGPVVAAVWR
jgi:(4S)-4-hydroxy-5-phosphonooxypentane-2,3-dione isomerase